MTTVFLYGKLAKAYGEKFCFSLSRPKDAISAIDANHEGFAQEIIDLASKGFQYTMIADDQIVGNPEDILGKRKIKEMHFVPTVCGSGAVALTIGAVALIGAIVQGVSTLLGSILLAVAFSAISFGIQSLMSKPPDSNNPSLKASTSATSKSFLFTNKENITQQGNPVPLGYGRLRIGSSVIQETVKSYPNSISTFDEFVSQNTQEGQSLMSVINNQEI